MPCGRRRVAFKTFPQSRDDAISFHVWRRGSIVIGFLTTVSFIMRFGRAHFAKVCPPSRLAEVHAAQVRSLAGNSDRAEVRELMVPRAVVM